MKILLAGLLMFILSLYFAPTAQASHSWEDYHWARTANPFTLKLGDNVTGSWDSHLSVASSDWSVSSVLDTTIVSGQGGKNCRPTTGRIEVCNRKYGNNGWLGVAQIWLSGSHITQGTAKMNDTYFSTRTYNTPAWRQLVMCQEVAHGFGLDHQDVDFNNANLGTCMDYTSSPESNQHPNSHDFEELESMYAHLDAVSTVDQSIAQLAQGFGEAASENPGNWGRLVRQNGRLAVFEKDFGAGFKIVTHVLFAE